MRGSDNTYDVNLTVGHTLSCQQATIWQGAEPTTAAPPLSPYFHQHPQSVGLLHEQGLQAANQADLGGEMPEQIGTRWPAQEIDRQFAVIEVLAHFGAVLRLV